jgi:hypothetical protein
METIKLKSGIIIKDNRSLSCGVMIENQDTKYMTLEYSSQNGFYLNIKNKVIKIDELEDYRKEFETMRLDIIEIKKMENKTIEN